MDCRTCQPTLIDLLYGELATDAAAEAQAHLKQCSSCRSAFDKLSHGMRVAQRMPRLEPPQAVGARLLQLADEHARAAVALRKEPARNSPGAWQSLLDFVGRFAMARQVGMATIMLLIVAVGMWALPQSRRARVADGGTVVTPEAIDEAPPAPAAQAPQMIGPTVAVPAEAEHAEAEADRSAEAEQREPTPAPVARRRARAGLSEAKSEPQAFPETAKKVASRAPAPPPAPTNDKASYKRGSVDDLLDGALAGSRDTGALRSQPSAAQQPAAPQPASAGPTERAEAEGASARASAPSASSTCDAARMREHQRTIDSAPSSAAAGQALLAMARCRRLSGEHTLARALLERAARNPHVAAQARALLGASGQPAKATAAEAAADDASP